MDEKGKKRRKGNGKESLSLLSCDEAPATVAKEDTTRPQKDDLLRRDELDEGEQRGEKETAKRQNQLLSRRTAANSTDIAIPFLAAMMFGVQSATCE